MLENEPETVDLAMLAIEAEPDRLDGGAALEVATERYLVLGAIARVDGIAAHPPQTQSSIDIQRRPTDTDEGIRGAIVTRDHSRP